MLDAFPPCLYNDIIATGVIACTMAFELPEVELLLTKTLLNEKRKP